MADLGIDNVSFIILVHFECLSSFAHSGTATAVSKIPQGVRE